MLSAEELFTFSDEMSMMIKGGISVVEAVTLMLEEAQEETEQKMLTRMRDCIYETGSLASAVKDAGVFPEYFCYMVEIGEQTGKTDEVLVALSNHYNREYAIYRAIKNAISYPLLMISMMFIIIIVLVTKIMPIFERVFIQLGSSMGGISGGILELGKFLSRYSMLFFVVVILVLGLIVFYARSESGKTRMITLGCKFKSFRVIYEKILVSRFASGMAMTISSGMDMAQALDVAGGLVDAKLFAEKLDKCKNEYQDTMDIGKALLASGMFTGLHGRMAILAAKTGHLDQVMEKVASTYQEEADEEIHRLIAIVEPTLVIILSVIVGMILLSVMLPLLSIMSGMN